MDKEIRHQRLTTVGTVFSITGNQVIFKEEAYGEQKQELFIVRRIGGTTYKVKVAFSETEKETMEDKILRMIRNEVVTNDGTCDIMDIPQMSRSA